MVKHIVMWRLGPDHRLQLCSDASLAKVVASMQRTIAGLVRIEIGLNRCDSPDAADLVLYSEFESWQALQRYEAHPLHDELKTILAPLRVERRVVNYESGPALA
jgi:hypothetical protein